MNLTTLRTRSDSVDRFKVPWWTRGDLNAFFGLAFNILVNVLTLTTLLIFVVHLPATRTLGTVLPALGIALIVGNAYYTLLARRLARREQRTDVTAMPYGPSVPHMFIVVFVIMLPIFLRTSDPVRAWAGRTGLGVHHRRHRADRCLHRAVHPQDHAAGGPARHPGRHLDQLHLDAPGRRRSGRPPGSACPCSASSWSASSPT